MTVYINNNTNCLALAFLWNSLGCESFFDVILSYTAHALIKLNYASMFYFKSKNDPSYTATKTSFLAISMKKKQQLICLTMMVWNISQNLSYNEMTLCKRDLFKK
jgi:hypothetical protein